MRAIQQTPDEMRQHGYTEDSVDGVMFIRTLTDEDVVAAARSTDSSGFRQARAFMGRDTNPSWITSQCAVDAYERGLVDQRELDFLMDN